ncbi:hypothetical protein ACJIZ3_009475 [Penstemon smallii]|uniref:Uncharacterized protein n=1 Tax=Penstemon smallii TaxID=265156 RepID=A0ABD3TCM1_9LAMI
MEAIISRVKTVPHFSSFKTPKTGFSFPSTVVSLKVNKEHQICLKQRILRSGYVSKLQCDKGNSVSELENDHEFNMEEELIGIRNLKGKCEETDGIVELLECLEREAIMGEDEGREPIDYNRRAHIFDKSSKVFQALKETNSAD